MTQYIITIERLEEILAQRNCKATFSYLIEASGDDVENIELFNRLTKATQKTTRFIHNLNIQFPDGYAPSRATCEAQVDFHKALRKKTLQQKRIQKCCQSQPYGPYVDVWRTEANPYNDFNQAPPDGESAGLALCEAKPDAGFNTVAGEFWQVFCKGQSHQAGSGATP